MSEPAVIHNLDAQGVATVTFNRPEVNNAYNGELLAGVLRAMDELGGKSGLRVVVLQGKGRHFQAGADLKWINSIRPQSPDANREASRMTAEVVDRLNRLPVPVVALVQGGCFGGGTGVIAACDVVVAADNAIFSIAEVRWGLHAAIIIPQLNDAMSVRQVRRYALTGERFDAAEAKRIGLVHDVVPLADLTKRGGEIVAQILQNSPFAIAKTKQHILESAWGGFDTATLNALIDSHATARQGPDAAEGLASFAEKRPAAWAPKA
jgi:methylglutaconyl-CoA hydratase